jgi:hypothetical protein
MGSIFIADFGTKDNVKTFRINGSKEDLLKLITECVEVDVKFIENPQIEPVKKNEFTVLLKIELSMKDGESLDTIS